MKFKTFIYLFFFLFFSNNLFAEKIAFIDMELLLQNSKIGSELSNELKVVNDQNINTLKSIEVEIRNKEEDLNKLKNIINENEYNKKVKLLKSEILAFNKKKDELTNKFLELKRNNFQKFLNKVDPVIKEYLKDNNIYVLLDKKNIYIGHSTLDITNDILKKINN